MLLTGLLFLSDKNERCALVVLTGRIVSDDLEELFVIESYIIASAENVAGEIVGVYDDARDARFFPDLIADAVRVLRERNAELAVDREDIRIETVKSADLFAYHVVEDAFSADYLSDAGAYGGKEYLCASVDVDGVLHLIYITHAYACGIVLGSKAAEEFSEL